MKDRLFWVLRLLPEVGGSVCCSSDGAEPSGRKLEVRWWVLGVQKGREETGGEVRVWSGFRTGTGAGVCGGAFRLWWGRRLKAGRLREMVSW